MRPRFCPNCAAPLSEEPHGAQEFTPGARPDRNGWDCFCDACHWSGDILPDYATEEHLEHHVRKCSSLL